MRNFNSEVDLLTTSVDAIRLQIGVRVRHMEFMTLLQLAKTMSACGSMTAVVKAKGVRVIAMITSNAARCLHSAHDQSVQQVLLLACNRSG